MATQLVLHLPVTSLHHECGSSKARLDVQQNFSVFAPSSDKCALREDNVVNGRASCIVCRARRERKERTDPFGRVICLICNEDTCGPAANSFSGILNATGIYGSNRSKKESSFITHYRAKKKWLDPFDWGDDPRMRSGLEFAEEGLQEPEPPTFPVDPNNEHGFLDFPAQYSVELASLPLLARGDVRKCCCVVTGGVYENLLFFPVIQLLKDRYPGVEIDIFAPERGKQAYELNKNVKYAWVYDVDSSSPSPADYLEFIGKMKFEDYDLLVSTKLSGAGHASTLWMTSARDKIAYVYPNVNAAGSGIFLTDWAEAPHLNLAEGGYHMYAELIEVLKNPKPSVPEMIIKPLQVGVSRKLREFVEKKYVKEGLSKGQYLVFHGIESISLASMQSAGDRDSLLPLKLWAEIAKATSVTFVIVLPLVSDKERVLEALGETTKTIFMTTPGQLAALINDSIGVVTTNTAAVQIACALKKPSVALFSSTEKASLFVPHAEERCCTVIASETGKLIDINIAAAIKAMKSIEQNSLVLS